MSLFRDRASEFERAGAQVYGINVDSPFSHAAFAEKLNLNFPLISDFNRQFIPEHVGYWEDVAGLKAVGRRVVFVVDKGGVVRYKWAGNVPSDLPNVDEVLEAVQSLGS